EAPADRDDVDERSQHPFAEPAGAHRGCGPVEDAEKRAAPLAAERLHELEVPPGRDVEAEHTGERVRLRRAQVRGPPAIDGVDVRERAAGGAGGDAREAPRGAIAGTRLVRQLCGRPRAAVT